MGIFRKRGEPFVVYITPSVGFRVIPLAYIAFLLLEAARFPSTIGLGRLADGFRNYPVLWWLIVLLVASLAFALRLAFPRRRSHARLQIQHDGVTFIPRRVDRYLFAEPGTEAPITPQSNEILLCHSFLEGLPDGYRVIVRGDDESEREMRVRFYAVPDVQDCRTIVESMTAVTGLPVRLVIRRRLMDGTVQETPWIPITRKANTSRSFVIVTTGATPFIGGIIIGYLQPRPAIIAVTGVALWCGQMLATFAYARSNLTRTKFPVLYALTTVFTFGAVYGLAIVIVAFVLRAR